MNGCENKGRLEGILFFGNVSNGKFAKNSENY